MRPIYIGFLLLALANTLLCHQLAEAQENMQSSVFGNGGGMMGNSDYRLTGTLGQPETGVSGSASNIVHAGFWYTAIRAPGQLPLISLTPASFTFNALPGVNPDDQILGIANAGSGVLLWTVSDDADWLFLSPAGGDSTGETDQVTVSVSIAEMSEGIYTASITVSSPSASNSPQIAPVTLSIFAGETHEHYMELGWNFISFPLHPLNGDPGIVLSSVITKCNAAWSYEADTGWYVYVPNGPSTLEEMERGKGYLIDMNGSGTLVTQGTNPGPEPIPLEGGTWHLVGHNSLSSLPIASIAPSMPDGTCICIYDSQAGRWLTYGKGCPDFLNTLTLLEPGRGYWFYVEQDWTINY
jgi:hypothetical protein